MSKDSLSEYAKISGTKNGKESVKLKRGVHALSKEELAKFSKLSSGGSVMSLKARKSWEESLTKLKLPLDFKPSVEEAEKLKLLRYFGRICDKHPESEGERYFSNKICITCCNNRSRKKKQNAT